VSIDFDFSELNQLSADLGEAPVKMIPLVRKAVEITARNIKDDWQEGAAKASGQHARLFPKSIDYDMGLDADGAITAEIGPNLGRVQGSLGILEDAPGGVMSRPQNAGRKAAKKNEQDFMDGLAKAAEEAI
jgi:hypothetical protein